ncbi:DTW domain-containing protein 1 [Apophysomyces sp. BC1034]|nr:DTW domain-containing protein 1 [Apophysomyces sp. BC1015]KAG0182301.1 DTW domain-containing protein 1 [Apophysomyces sp. BC1021]KAG0193402.1 DTW domain-containing protein 1 [Apophysomyces sp. BC1034]
MAIMPDPNPKVSEQNTASRKRPRESPFDDLKISNDAVLHRVTTRQKCPKCSKTVKYFCYRCFDVVGMDRSEIPSVKLPVHLDVIKHERELDGKSTAIHARVIADKDVDLYSWQNMPSELENPERTLLLFPGPDAQTLHEIPQDSFDRVVVIDGTWKQANKIARETPALQGLRKVTIAPRTTHFWRYQQVNEHHLATIEAIYYFYREYGESYMENYDGRYDDLLFYYRFFYDMIQDDYRRSGRKFTHRHKQNYIKPEQTEGAKAEEENEHVPST